MIETGACDVSGQEDIYYACDSTGKVWYNPKKNSIIYSKERITLQKENIWTAVKNLFSRITGSVAKMNPPSPQPFVSELKVFDRLYMEQEGSKKISGAIEGYGFKNLVIEYEGFAEDICAFVNDYGAKHSDEISGIQCRPESGKYYVAAQGNEFAELDPDKVFDDLTAKLR